VCVFFSVSLSPLSFASGGIARACVFCGGLSAWNLIWGNMVGGGNGKGKERDAMGIDFTGRKGRFLFWECVWCCVCVCV